MEWFENDVKMYGTQTRSDKKEPGGKFENDVKMYGTQTLIGYDQGQREFENDVKMYGTQTRRDLKGRGDCLRMM